MALKVGELFASFNLDTSGIDSAVSGAEKSLSNIGKGLTIGGAAMTAAVTVPLVKAAKDIYSAGSSFDAQMAKVFAIAGDSVTGSTEKMEALRKKALEMGSTTQFTASQAGQAFEYMAMAGWKTEQMLSGIEPLMNLAAAAGADLGTTSDIVTDAMTAFGLAATDTVEVVKDGMKMNVNAVEYFADILAATSSNSNTNVTMLGESFKYAAPLAGSLGYSLNDVAVALGLMANNGIKSSMAGTSLSRVIQNMAKPSDQTAIAMEKLGLSLYDSKGNVKSLRDLMNDFRGVAKKNNVDITEMTKKVGDLDAQFKAGKITEAQYEKELTKLTEGSGDFLGAITQIAGARGLPGLLAIMNATDKDFDSLVHAIDNATGSAGKMKQVMLDNVEGAVTILKSAVEGLEITLWGLVKGPVKSMIERATTYVDAFRKMDSATQEGVLRMAAYAASIGPAMTGSGMLLTVLPKIAKGISLMASPLGLVSIGLLAVGAASMDAKNLMGKNLEKMAKSASASMKKVQKSLLFKNWVLASRGNKFLDSVIASIKEAGPVFMDTLSSLLMTGISAVGRLMPKAAETATTLVKTITDGIARHAPALMRQLGRSMTSLATSVIGAVPDMLNAGMTLFSALIDAAGKVDWLSIGTKLNTAIKDALKEIRTNFYTLVFGEEPTAEDLGDWGKLGAKITENIKAGIKTASDNGKNLIGGLVLGNDYQVSDTWGDVAQKIWGKITSSMPSLLENAGDLLQGLVLGADYDPGDSWETVATKIWEKIKEKIGSLKESTKNIIGTISLGEDYSADDSWDKIGTAIWNKIKEKIQSLKDSTKNIIGSIVLGDDYKASATWNNVATAIWQKIKDKIKSLKESTKNIVGSIALGEDYTASDSWGKIGTAIWNKICEKLNESKENVKDLIGELVLGDDYQADDSWKKIGSAIWAKAKEGFSSLSATAKDIIGDLTLGQDYMADDSWRTVGTKIWAKIKSGLGSMPEKIKAQIGKFTLGENYDPGTSWSTIGEKIWEKVQSGIAAGKDIAAAILEKIGTVNIDVAGILTTVQNAGTFVTNLVSNMLDGRITWGNEITGLAQKIADQLAAYGWDDIGNTLGKVANNLISAITGAIPKAIDAAGNAVDVGLTLADGILSSVSSALTGEGLDLNLSAIVQSLVNNLIRILPKAFTVGEEAVSAGFKLATSLLDSLAGAFDSTISAEGISSIGEKLGDVARKIINGITTLLPKLFEAGGKAVSAGAKLASELVGSLAAGLSETDYSSTFASVAQSIVQGITEAVANLPAILDNALSAGAQIASAIMTSITDAIVGTEESEAAVSLGKMAGEFIHQMIGGVTKLGENEDVQSFMRELGEGFKSAMGQLGQIAGEIVKYILSRKGLTDLWNAGTTIVKALLGGIKAAFSSVGEFINQFMQDLLQPFTDWFDQKLRDLGLITEDMPTITLDGLTFELGSFQLDNSDQSGGKAMLAAFLAQQTTDGLDKYVSKEVQGSLQSITWEKMGLSNIGDFLSRLTGAIILSDKSSDSIRKAIQEKFTALGLWEDIAGILDDEFYEGLAESFGDSEKMDEFFSEYLKKIFGGDSAEEIVASAEEAAASAEEARDAYIDTLLDESGVAEKGNEFYDTMNTASKQGMEGFTQGVADGTSPAADAGLEASDAVVQTFLMTMSAENGQAIGRQFIDGIIAILDDGTLVSAADVLGQSAFTSLSNALSGAAGVSIGRNFGLGLANGISSMTGAVTSAAWNLGISAANALSSAIQEGSPSKLTYKSGGNFGLGFINSIMDMSDNAAEAAASMGRSAAKALEYTVQDIGSEASQIDYPLRSGYDRAAEAYHAERQNDPAIEQMADRIIEALGHMAVCIDGEPAGQILTPYVSEIMAHGTSVRR